MRLWNKLLEKISEGNVEVFWSSNGSPCGLLLTKHLHGLVRADNGRQQLQLVKGTVQVTLMVSETLGLFDEGASPSPGP